MNKMFGFISKKKMKKDLEIMRNKANKSYSNNFKEGEEQHNKDLFNYNQGECNVYNYLIDVYLR